MIGSTTSMFYNLTKNTVDYAISLNKIADKKKVLKVFLNNIDDYVGDPIEKRIIKDNFKYAISLKTASSINKTLKTSLNALK